MDTAIQAANERMVYVTGDKEAIRAYEMRQMALSDRTSELNYAIEKEHQYFLNMLDKGLSVEEIKQRLAQRKRRNSSRAEHAE